MQSSACRRWSLARCRGILRRLAVTEIEKDCRYDRPSATFFANAGGSGDDVGGGDGGARGRGAHIGAEVGDVEI